MTARRLRPRSPETSTPRDSGFTLIELLVAVVLMSILGIVVSVTFGQGMRATRAADARTSDSAQLRVAQDDMARLLRTAVDPDGPFGPLVAFERATPTDVVFYAAVRTKGATLAADLPPTRVRLWVDGPSRRLLEERRTGPGWLTVSSTRTVARDLIDPQPGPVFIFTKEGESAIGADGRAVSTFPPSADLALADRRLIRGVEMWLSVNGTPTSRGDNSTAVTRVTLMNR